MVMTNVLVLAVCGAIVGGYAAVVRDGPLVAAFARRVSLSTALGFGALATLFVAGYAFSDLPLSQAALLTAGWVLPMIGLALWAWFSPRTAEPALWVVLVALLALAIWWALDPARWGAVMDQQGPVVAVLALATGVALTVWAYHRPLRGGLALLAVAVVPFLAVLLTEDPGQLLGATSTVVAVSPFLTCGLLALLAHRLGNPRTRARAAPAVPSHP